MEVVDARVAIAPAISLLCAALVFAAADHTFWRRFFSLSAALAKLIIVMSMLPGALKGVVYTFDLVEFTPGVGLAFRADALGMFFAVVSSTLWLFTSIYAIGYMEREPNRRRFFGFFALCVSTTVGVAFAENLLTLFLFYETLTICTYPLVVHDETPEAMRAGRTYLAYTLTGGAFVLLGSIWTYQLAGTMTLSQPGILTMEAGRTTLTALFVCLIAGFGVKAAIMPLHGWLPTAMVAPTPVSALLHAVAVVKVGAFGVLRTIYNVFGVDLLQELGVCDWLAALAGITIIAASVIAIFQDNFKRRLAFSTISQLSYIVLGAALLSPLAATAAIVHIANQAFAKITMFFVAGSIQRTTGKTAIHEFAGIGYRMPYTMGAFTVAALSFIGIPLFAGFVTKWYLSLGALESDQWIYALVMLGSSLLNAAYWLPIIYTAFFKSPREDALVHEAHWTMLGPTLLCAAYVLLLGMTVSVPGMPFALAQAAVKFVFGM
ncbi:MAG: monovalent cation/H+ antiporter subunit D family protein [Coriobacteriia bacterium]|nr:monovalent cation/H+ antiporter subunit D family protein [Coriobacteriia bacterium]